MYLAIDNRVGDGVGGQNDDPTLGGGVMDWVLDMGFVNTGMDIGVDESGNGDINSWSSLFRKTFPSGRLELMAQDWGGVNMYGVMLVVPEPSTKL